jgi:hypothetical protein
VGSPPVTTGEYARNRKPTPVRAGRPKDEKEFTKVDGLAAVRPAIRPLKTPIHFHARNISSICLFRRPLHLLLVD